MLPLDQRELAFRAALDPTLPLAEVEDAVADWLRRQPEAMAENRRILAGKLREAEEAIDTARDLARATSLELVDNELRMAERYVWRAQGVLEPPREPVVTALPGRLVDGSEVVG